MTQGVIKLRGWVDVEPGDPAGKLCTFTVRTEETDHILATESPDDCSAWMSVRPPLRSCSPSAVERD